MVSWELITIYHQYGLLIWTGCTFLNLLCRSYLYRPECVACPYVHITSLLAGHIRGSHVVIRILSQLAGGSVFFRITCSVWDLHLTTIHVGRAQLMSYGECFSWLAVPSWIGFMIESFATLTSCFFANFLFDFHLFPNLSIHRRILMNSTFTICLVLMAFYRTGGFLQPLLAYARTFGCRGVLQEVTPLHHLFVYWVGPTLGAIISFYLAPLVKRKLFGTKMEKKPFEVSGLDH